MMSFKGILKYSIYLVVAGWMFLLGIMVGRGNSPVTFDTQQFQDRLETIASEFGENKEQKKKIELKYYDVLEKPVPEEGLIPKKNSKEIIPKKELTPVSETGGVKTSLKKQTYKKPAGKAKETARETITQKETLKTKAPNIKPNIKSVTKIDNKTAPVEIKKPVSVATKKQEIKKSKKVQAGKYTIQIAAYKDFKDAVTHMAILDKKGFSSYRVKGQKDGVTWYRIRTGSFATYDEAKKFKLKLEKAKIKSMILKKDV